MSNRFTSGWPDERVEALRRFAAQKMSGSQISEKLGVSRSAVMGKAMRLGIKIDSGEWGRKRPKGPRGEPKPVSEPRIARVEPKPDRTAALAPTQPKAESEPAESAPIRVTIHELRASSCRWPLGDPGDLDTFRYCGARVDLPGVVPYCSGHCRLAYARAG